ncbi:hypothetical protein C8F04DRAFT_1277260 [Mycena alexandri]|uniref:Uncharacterized protein n=1 Tax=Mycena alexandri TaxID=1745969 RepID=A0AAD6S155_9AGAR|nr:hypothetical protein C8F04DRAFT_1277260 [Mycena alexandri]
MASSAGISIARTTPSLSAPPTSISPSCSAAVTKALLTTQTRRRQQKWHRTRSSASTTSHPNSSSSHPGSSSRPGSSSSHPGSSSSSSPPLHLHPNCSSRTPTWNKAAQRPNTWLRHLRRIGCTPTRSEQGHCLPSQGSLSSVRQRWEPPEGGKTPPRSSNYTTAAPPLSIQGYAAPVAGRQFARTNPIAATTIWRKCGARGPTCGCATGTAPPPPSSTPSAISFCFWAASLPRPKEAAWGLDVATKAAEGTEATAKEIYTGPKWRRQSSPNLTSKPCNASPGGPMSSLWLFAPDLHDY